MPSCESTSSIHRRPKRSKASIFAGTITYSTTQVIMPQASGVRQGRAISGMQITRLRGNAPRNCAGRLRGNADARRRCPAAPRIPPKATADTGVRDHVLCVFGRMRVQAVFLVSSAASFMTGANLLVDGALTRGVQF
jgi:hypothetical protein